jgi:endonuclease/exonuclease/phosphatase family metal-dependent hydrolase
MQTLRLLTLNIWSHHPPWPTRKRLIQQGLVAESPDLVALQEVLQPHGPGTAQADELAEGLGYRVVFSRACRLTSPVKADYGIALLSRFPIREHRTELLPTPPELEPRALLYALCSVKVGVLPVLVTHLSWEPELAHVRAVQLAHIASYVQKELAVLPARLPPHVAILPPVLLGDLNMPPESPELRAFLRDTGFIDCFAAAGQGAGLTMDGRNPGATKDGVLLDGRIDYLMLGPAPPELIRVRSARLCLDRDEAGVFPSDHFGVVADLELGPIASA